MKNTVIHMISAAILLLTACANDDWGIRVTGVRLDHSSVTLQIGESANLSVYVIPGNATEQTVYWQNSNPDVASFDNGKITALKPGFTYIGVTTMDGEYNASCQIVVREPVITINVQFEEYTYLTAGSITGSLTVEASATGGATISYQWYTRQDNGLSMPIPGATDASFKIPETLAAGGYRYFCEIKATAGATELIERSNEAQVFVGSVITITSQPAETTNISEGYIIETLNISVNAELNPQIESLMLQWYSNITNSNTGGTAISGATRENFTIPRTLGAGTYYYFCEIRTLFNGIPIRSNVATVNVAALTGTWTRKADFAGERRYSAVGFFVGNKGYIGTGYSDRDRNTFWEYDPATNVWTQKADFEGERRQEAVGFSIDNKGYIGTGWVGASESLNDLWEYDPVANEWTQKADFPGEARSMAVGFSIGNKGYIGTGYSGNIAYRDFWEYDPVSDVWTQKADFPGETRSGALGFSIGNKGYIGAGSGNRKDFWEYDTALNLWTQKADFPGESSYSPVGYSIGNKGYAGISASGNTYTDFWEFDPVSNVWIRKTSLDVRISHAVGFSIGNKGYVGTGVTSTSQTFWEFTP